MTRIAHIVALFTLLSACTSTHGLKADLSKIRPWSLELERSEPLPAPYVVDFEEGTRALTFVAVEHSNEASSPSLKLIGSAMEARHYSAVVLEGFSRSQGISPESMKKGSELDGANGFYRDGETSVAVKMAVKKSVPFVGGEPDEQLVLAAVVAAGFTVDDLYGFYVTRMIPQWRHDGTLTRQSFEESYIETAPRIAKKLGMKEPSLEFFHRWYQAKMQKPFRVREVSDDVVAPLAAGALFTQKISAVIGKARNEHIVRVTEEMLNKYGRVLVVYGASHYPMQQLALESMLGKPDRISDQP